MDPITIIQTTWEVVRNVILQFTSGDEVPDHPHPVSHSSGNSSAGLTVQPSIYFYDPELDGHRHHKERQQKKIMHKLHELAKHDINLFGNIPPETLAKLLLLGLFFVPATASAVSLGMTVMTLGPIAEA